MFPEKYQIILAISENIHKGQKQNKKVKIKQNN